MTRPRTITDLAVAGVVPRDLVQADSGIGDRLHELVRHHRGDAVERRRSGLASAIADLVRDHREVDRDADENDAASWYAQKLERELPSGVNTVCPERSRTT